MRLRRFTTGRDTDLRIERKACFPTEKMGPREWERLKVKHGGGSGGRWHARMTLGVRSWRNRKNQGKGRDGRVGLRHKKNDSSSKIIVKEVRIDDEVCGFVRVQSLVEELRRIVHSSLNSFCFCF